MSMLIKSSPITYNEWMEFLCDLLKIPQDFDLAKASLPKPWLLAPGDEIQELDADNLKRLYEAVKTRIFSKNNHQGGTTSTIASLNQKGLLPLLYALREIARTKGQSNRYWPEVYASISDTTQYSQSTFNGIIVPALTQAWVRLFNLSNGQLYRPQNPSHIHIAWPFAHAGLLASDRNVLVRFGMFLAGDWERGVETIPIAISEESPLSEFWNLFEVWANHSPGVSGFLGRLNGDSEAVRITRLELAKDWLQNNWNEVEKKLAEEEKNAGEKKRNSLSIKLIFNVQTSSLAVSIGKISGFHKVKVSLGNEATTYFARSFTENNEPQIEGITLPLTDPNWSNLLEIELGQQVVLKHLPPSPFSNSEQNKRFMLFRVGDGKIINRWLPKTNYYAVVPATFNAQEAFSGLFDPDFVDLGMVKGSDWGTFRVLYLTSSPLQSQNLLSAPTSTKDRTTQLKELGDKLGLGGFDDLQKIQIRPIGGLQLSSEKSYDVFDQYNPPTFELSTYSSPKNNLISLFAKK